MKRMRHISHFIFVCCLVISFQAMAARTLPYIPTPAEPQLDAKSYVLQDNTSGAILVSKNPNERVEPASLTKMMTVYVVDHELRAGRLSPNDKVRISEKAWRTEGSRMFVDVNTDVPVQELLKGVIIQSGNDASVALAEHIAGSEEAFAELMNYYAQQLGMTNTNFVNATGLPNPNHYSTAADMSKLGHALITDFPESYKVYSQKEFLYNNIKQTNRNLLLWRDKTVDGIKTGHTDSAGYCLVASAARDGMRLNAVVMGAANDGARTEQAQRLLNYGFRFYTTQSLVPAKKPIAKAKVYQGKQKEVQGGVLNDLYVTLPQGQQGLLNTHLALNDLKAPIKQGEIIGNLQITLNDNIIAEQPVVALEPVERGNIWQRFVDWLKLFFANLFSSSSQTIVETFNMDTE